MISSHAVREMRIAILERIINRSRRIAILTTGELLDIERVTSSSGRGGWKRADDGTSLAAYSTHVRFEVAGDGNQDRA
jgi:hypothetical protein